MKNEHWHELDMMPQGQETNELKQYCKIKDSLSLKNDQNIILMDKRILIPLCFETIVVTFAHSSHQGLIKIKSLPRSRVFFLNRDKMIAERLAFCISC